MVGKHQILGYVAGLGLLLGTASGGIAAETPHKAEQPNHQFRRIEQPLGLKLGVTAGGLVLIGGELWWFLWSKTKGQQQDTQGHPYK